MKGTNEKGAQAYTSTKARHAKKFITFLLQARTITLPLEGSHIKENKKVNGEATHNKILNRRKSPYLTPQQLEFGLYLITSFLADSKMTIGKYRFYNNLRTLAYNFAKKTDYQQHTSEKTLRVPSEQFIQKALKKLKQINLIDYEYGKKKVSKTIRDEMKSKNGSKPPKGIRVGFLKLDRRKHVKELYEEYIK